MSSLALDRQIRPIYDALDTGLNKLAITACNKLLKKHPKSELIKALKALALIRCQKVEESLVLCDEILETKPTSDAVLTAMMHVLRGLGRHSDMVSMYEEAYKQQPANEELGAQTFFANIRAGYWKMAQQISARMHKQFHDDRYLYWSAMSAVLQAQDTATPESMRMVLYKLAQRLVATSPSSSLKSADRFHLHLSITSALGLFNEARELLDSDVGKGFCNTNLSCNEIRRDVWSKCGLTGAEGEHAKNLILEEGDRNWLEFSSLLDSTFKYISYPPKECSSEAATSNRSAHIEETRRILEKIAEQDGNKDRSGLLALLELEKRNAGLSKEMVALMQRYFEQIGDKACCFEDLKPYLDLPEKELAVWTGFLASVQLSTVNVAELRRYINSCKLLRHNLNLSHLTIDSEKNQAFVYAKGYLECLALGSDLPLTELQPSDDLALLAGNVYVNLWTLSGDANYLICAAVLLEYMLTKSKSFFIARLVLIRIYRLLGAPSVALDHYRALQVKQVQHDTLSHFILSRASTFSLAASGDLTFATECIESTQIYLSNSQDTSDFVVRAFSSEKYSQIPGFVEFEERLDNSLQRDIVKMEHLRMRLSHEMISSDIIDMELIELKFIFDRTHYDNRDYGILTSYQPHICKDLNYQTRLFGKGEGHGWLATFLKLYIRILQQGSDLDDTVEDKLLIGDRPKQSVDASKKAPLQDRLTEKSGQELAELTHDEILLVDFAAGLAEWLKPYHDYARPSPSVVLAEAAKQTELKIGHPLKGIESIGGNRPSHVNGKKDEEPPAVIEPPSVVTKYFHDAHTRFHNLKSNASPSDLLHVATLAQEAFILFNIGTQRFKSASVVKVNKFGGLVSAFKDIRATAISKLKDIADTLIKYGEQEVTVGQRTHLVECFPEVSDLKIDRDFVFGVIKNLTDARKKVMDGIGKGMKKVCDNYPLQS